MPLTFEEFQATRKPVTCLSAAVEDLALIGWGRTVPGYVYLDGTLYIERLADDVSGPGRYHLYIEQHEWLEDDLEVVERELYYFAISAGYDD